MGERYKGLSFVVALLGLSMLLLGCSRQKYLVTSEGEAKSPMVSVTPEEDTGTEMVDLAEDALAEEALLMTEDTSSDPVDEIEYMYITGDGVRMREAPSTQAEILVSLKYGIEVIFLAEEGAWSKVEYENHKGYIRNDLLSASPPQPRESQLLTASSNVEELIAPKIIVKKSERLLELWDGDRLYATYPVGLGWSPEGHKHSEGDGRTPEGTYYVCTRNSYSRFYLSLGVSYPNEEDAATALEEGLIDTDTYRQIANAINRSAQPPWNTPMGGEIMIHGMGSGSDWTAGCVAVDNEVMDILWKHCPIGTPIIIQP